MQESGTHNTPSSTGEDATLALITRSGLFDPRFYATQLALENESPNTMIRHYLESGWRLNFDPGPLFSTTAYLDRNPDIRDAQLDPLTHFLNFGAYEGRLAWTGDLLKEWQGGLIERSESALQETQNRISLHRWPTLSKGDSISICAHSRGNFFFLQIQEMLGQALTEVGVSSMLVNENTFTNSPRSALTIVVAPHEFYYLGNEQALRGNSILAQSIPFNTEQMQTAWFARAFPYLLRAEHVLDMNIQTAGNLARLGINAQFLPLGYVAENTLFQLQEQLSSRPSVKWVPKVIRQAPPDPSAPLGERAIDVLFVGMATERREAFFARHAAFFASKICFLHLTPPAGPLLDGDPRSVAGRDFAALAQRSKILLNIHHGDTPYFEWQRIVHYGILQRCCTVTENSSRIPGLIAGEHYLQDDLNKIPNLIQWLLNERDGQEKAERVRKSGYDAVLNQFVLSRTLTEVFRITDVGAP